MRNHRLALDAAGCFWLYPVSFWRPGSEARHCLDMRAHQKRFIGITLVLAGFALVCASPFLVQSPRLMWHLRGFGGVFWLEDSDFPSVAHVRWMVVFGGIAYCLIMAGVYVLQSAKKRGRFIPKS